MPGPSGEDVVRTIKEGSPGTIAIILTGFGSIDSVRRMMAVGCDGYLLKPVTNLDSITLAIVQARERQQMLLRNVVLQRQGKDCREAIQAFLELIVPRISAMQENVTAMRATLEEKDIDEALELLDAAESEMASLEVVLEKVGSQEPGAGD